MTEKFKTKEEIIKWKYCGKIGAKSENNFMKKYPVKAFEKSEEDPEEKEYMGGPIKIKISVEDDFTSSFLKLPDCVSIDCDLDSKADMPYKKMWKIYSEAKKSPFSTTARNMREVAHYSYVSLFNTHYRANGMK
ncbi:19507_t:CDS:2, partial [Funneliformis geosporum]